MKQRCTDAAFRNQFCKTTRPATIFRLWSLKVVTKLAKTGTAKIHFSREASWVHQIGDVHHGMCGVQENINIS